MSKCFLCDEQAEIYGQDVGRRKTVRCDNCIYYEITNSALAKIQSDDFSKDERDKIAKEVANIMADGQEPLIACENKTVMVIRK